MGQLKENEHRFQLKNKNGRPPKQIGLAERALIMEAAEPYGNSRWAAEIHSSGEKNLSRDNS